MYLVTSLTNWNTDESLENALKASYQRSAREKSEIIIADNNIVETFGQASVKVEEKYRNEFFALKLVISSVNIPEEIKYKHEELTDLLYSADLELIADCMPYLTQEIVEVYAINYNDSKLLTTFSATENNLKDVVYEIESCEEAFNILNISSKSNSDLAS